MMMPITNAKENPLSTSPPKMKRESTVMNVRPEVSTVRLRVWLMLRFTRSVKLLAAADAKIFADAVEDDDGVVHRVADQGENGGDDGQADLAGQSARRRPR